MPKKIKASKIPKIKKDRKEKKQRKYIASVTEDTQTKINKASSKGPKHLFKKKDLDFTSQKDNIALLLSQNEILYKEVSTLKRRIDKLEKKV